MIVTLEWKGGSRYTTRRTEPGLRQIFAQPHIRSHPEQGWLLFFFVKGLQVGTTSLIFEDSQLITRKVTWSVLDR
jgi:hypothetical protein